MPNTLFSFKHPDFPSLLYANIQIHAESSSASTQSTNQQCVNGGASVFVYANELQLKYMVYLFHFVSSRLLVLVAIRLVAPKAITWQHDIAFLSPT